MQNPPASSRSWPSWTIKDSRTSNGRLQSSSCSNSLMSFWVHLSAMLLDCEEIVQEWRNWKKVNDEYLSNATVMQNPFLDCTRGLGVLTVEQV
jgi:hypothetical protein